MVTCAYCATLSGRLEYVIFYPTSFDIRITFKITLISLEETNLAKLHIFSVKYKINTHSEELFHSDDCVSGVGDYGI